MYRVALTHPGGWQPLAVLHSALAGIGRLLLLAWALTSMTGVHAQTRPDALLFGATAVEAHSFAIDLASQHGWRIATSNGTGATFEQVLEADGDGPMLTVNLLLRVRAGFATESDGVRVSLSAVEIHWPGTAREHSEDVTSRYSANLMNALTSLQSKWDQHRTGGTTGDRQDPMLATPYTPPAQTEPGTWSYYAEQYAQRSGCELTNQGALLESSEADWETYRVDCQNGSILYLHCRYGECTSQ